MKRTINRTSQRNISYRLHLIFVTAAAAFVYLAAGLFIPSSTAQTLSENNGFRIGERLTYNVTMGRYQNAAYAEIYCVSRGKLADKDAIELRAKFRTLELASAAFYMVDESRTTFVSPSTGLPLYTSVTENSFGLPKETSQDFIKAPTPHADLLTMIYRIRQTPGTGSLTMQEGDKVYPVTFQSGVVEKRRTDAGEFETTLVSVQSDYFTERGMTDVRLNLSNDEARLPVMIRFKTAKGEVKAGLASIQSIEPETAPQVTATPVRTPTPERTPKPPATPVPYVPNQTLTPDLAFDLGERLEYRVFSGGQAVGTMRLAAKERTQMNGLDSLLLETTFSDVRTGAPFANGDVIRAYVDPESLAPRQFEMRFSGPLRGFTNSVKFEREGSLIQFGTNRVDAPVGTHTILSLLYAARSFNLKPSRDANNPINDTRVAVFWESQPYIFTLRPSQPEVLMIDGKPIAAQMITVTTKHPLLDQLSIKVWLGTDDARVPVRFMVGGYTADLVSTSKILPN